MRSFSFSFFVCFFLILFSHLFFYCWCFWLKYCTLARSYVSLWNCIACHNSCLPCPGAGLRYIIIQFWVRVPCVTRACVVCVWSICPVGQTIPLTTKNTAAVRSFAPKVPLMFRPRLKVAYEYMKDVDLRQLYSTVLVILYLVGTSMYVYRYVACFFSQTLDAFFQLVLAPLPQAHPGGKPCTSWWVRLKICYSRATRTICCTAVRGVCTTK